MRRRFRSGALAWGAALLALAALAGCAGKPYSQATLTFDGRGPRPA